MRAINYTVRLTYTVRLADYAPGLWSLSDRELAQGCLYIAQGRVPGVKLFLRAHAMRVFLLWRDAIGRRHGSLADFEQLAGIRAAFRKRTIQLLVQLSPMTSVTVGGE
ncbi:MAG TPA: hypothetical protein VGJ21_26230 [Terracidiphilus sp.]|jgi:hypothetical protein